MSLETTREALQEAEKEDYFETADVEAYMGLAMKLLMARLVDVKFPLDRDGNPDFMDAWSAEVRYVGPSNLTAFAAMSGRDSGTGRLYQVQLTIPRGKCLHNW